MTFLAMIFNFDKEMFKKVKKYSVDIFLVVLIAFHPDEIMLVILLLKLEIDGDFTKSENYINLFIPI